MKMENYKPTGRPAGRLGRLTPEQRETKKRKFVKEFIKCQGEWKKAAENTGVSVATIKYWIKEDPDFKDRVYDAEQKFVDEVEQELFKLIRKGNVYAMMFYLECKGKDRGYVKREPIVKKEEPKGEEENKEYKLDFGGEK